MHENTLLRGVRHISSVEIEAIGTKREVMLGGEIPFMVEIKRIYNEEEHVRINLHRKTPKPLC